MSCAQLKNVPLFQIRHGITSLSFVENTRAFHSTSRCKKDPGSKMTQSPILGHSF